MMWKELVLGVSSLINTNGSESSQTFHAEALSLPSGTVEISTPFEWNAIALIDKDGNPLPKVWYHANNNRFPWYNAESETGSIESDLLDLVFFGKTRNSLIIESPENLEVIAHFFNTKIEGENLKAEFAPLDDDSYDDPRTGLARTTLRPKYITRQQWGADETLRLWNPQRGFRTAVPEAKELPVVLRPKIVQRFAENGQRLRWPLEENRTIRKFIVHHTGEVTDETRDPYELMRAIYYYHTITRGWGDIGYHYVVDKQGNIYEGRAGGNKMVGAHTALHNVGSIGISLMGNFQEEKPTDAQVRILKLILADHTNRFKIDPTQKSYWLGTNSFNVSGHKDVARPGHGTACPGKNLHILLPEIRKEAKAIATMLKKENKKSGVDFLSKSRAAPKIQRRVDRNKQKPAEVALAKLIKKEIMQRGERSYLDIHIRNSSESTWKRGEKIYVTNIPDGMKVTAFNATQNVEPGEDGVFRARIIVETTPNGTYQLELTPRITNLSADSDIPTFSFPIQISGSKDMLSKKIQATRTIIKSSDKKTSQLRPAAYRQSNTKTAKKTAADTKSYGPDVKVKLSYFDEKYAVMSADKSMWITSEGKTIATISQGKTVKIVPTENLKKFNVSSGAQKWTLINPQFETQGVIKIHNYNRGLGRTAYNRFRKKINAHWSGRDSLYLVNELPIEEYLWGLAEEPSSQPDSKKHAIHILARSYALVYSGERRKFKTSLYDLEDSPATSQFYLGYDWELYHSDQKTLVNQTKGRVITYKGKPVIGPYFTQSSGSSSSKWTSQYPWTEGRSLPLDKGLEQKGHGVGLSGNSARVLAEQGKNYIEILNYFFNGIKVQKAY